MNSQRFHQSLKMSDLCALLVHLCTELWWWGLQSRDRRYDNIHDFVSQGGELIQTARAGSRGQDHADIARETLQEELPQECVVCGTGTFSHKLLEPT